jgi:hypothetical protein
MRDYERYFGFELPVESHKKQIIFPSVTDFQTSREKITEVY